ncbi:hypothetical protein BSKO_00415 [Bryopsis sp. KO-2023]|nr:hypothetical protein BSKO_00415 [Bryopsis sp. KO-2023]
MEHSNVYVKNLPPEVDDQTLLTLFQSYGRVDSCKVMQSRSPQARNFGFVKFSTVEEARMAIEQMNGATVASTVIEVRFADADIGNKKPQVKEETDNLYVKGFPSEWSDQDLKILFESCGKVVECRVLQSRDPERGGVGLVRMSAVAEATLSIQSFHNRAPPGGSIVMSVTYADTKEEKERKIRKRTPAPQRYDPYQRPVNDPFQIPTFPGAVDMQRQGLLDPLGLGLGNSAINQQAFGNVGLGAANLMLDVPGQGLGLPPPPNGMGGVMGGSPPASLYIRNIPPEADKLYLYEKFAPFGGIRSVKVLEDEAGQCKGVGFVNFLDQEAAQRAIEAFHGKKVGEKELHVSLQTQRPKRNVRTNGVGTGMTGTY